MKRVALVLALCLPMPGALAQDTLGRLFFTPQQRASLDAAREKAVQPQPRPAESQTPAPVAKAPPPKVMTLNGIVRRSDGGTTVWVNDRAMHGSFGDVDVAGGAGSRAAVTVRLPSRGRHVRLKVGQTVDATTGAVEEGYRRPPRQPIAAVQPPPETPAKPSQASADAPRQRDATQDEDDDGNQTTR